MIRHVVMWKFGAQDDAGKAAAYEAVRGALEPLAHLEGIRSLSVIRNTEDVDGNSDAVLIGDYESRDALDAYLVHPEHVAAVAIVRSHTVARAAIDFSLVE